MLKSITQTYNDGVASIYFVKNSAQSGNVTAGGISLKATLPYEERAVGINRYYAAMQNKIKVVKVLRFPRIKNVAAEDIVIPIDEKQYRAVQVQYPPDVTPPSMDITLEMVIRKYDIATT